MRLLQILLAEDNQGDVRLVREALLEHRIEHELQVMTDGQQVLDYLAGLGQPSGPPCPDVMLLDLNLPKADGPTVLAEFRRHPLCSHVPVIVVTSSDATRDRSRMAQLGISYYFRKPTDYAEYMQLGAIIRAVLTESLKPPKADG
jgi:two-component system, chemotaxis family, response regulator Rcp1